MSIGTAMSAMSAMSAELVPLRSLTPGDEERWRALAGRALEPNPSFEPEAVRAAVAHDPSWSDAHLLATRHGERLVACLPVRPVGPRRDVPVAGLTTRVDPGPVPLLPVLGTPLVDPELLRPAVGCLLEALASGRLTPSGRTRPAVLTLERWNDGGPVAAAWRDGCRVLGLPLRVVDRWERPVLRSPAAGEAAPWPASLGAKRLADARRKRRRLGEHLGSPVRVVDRIAGSADVLATVDEFVRLEGAGWKGRAGSSLSETPALGRAFREACLRWAAAGRLSVLALEVDGVTLAMRCAVRSGTGFFLLRIAYDESYGRYGPGVLLELDTGRHFLDLPGVERMDPCCAPTNSFYPDFLPERLPVATALTALRADGRAALAAQPLLRRSVRVARRARSLARRAGSPGGGAGPDSGSGSGPRPDSGSGSGAGAGSGSGAG